MQKLRIHAVLALATFLGGLLALTARAETPASVSGEPRAVVVKLQGAISPATALYFSSALEDAVDSGARLLVLELDTPGGLDQSMRSIIQDILGSPIPVVTWVSPSGARAASAGTYILYASHVAAMAPATNLGAATPIPVGGAQPAAEPLSPQQPGEADPDADPDTAPPATPAQKAGDAIQGADGQAETAASRKAVSDAVAYIRSLAERRGRNAEWAERAVREGVSLSARQALEMNVVDIIARDLDELFEQIDGRTTEVSSGEITLAADGLIVERVEPDWRVELLAIITNPTLAYILMMIGIYGLLLEGYNPGSLVPGTVGAICLLLALFAFQVLPVNYAGLGLILLGVALMVAEAFAPSFGVLGLGGVAAFVFGSVLLMDTDMPGYGIDMGVIIGMALVSAVLVLGTIWLAARAHTRRVATGTEGLVGQVGIANDALEAGGTGWAVIASETWRVRSDAPVAKGGRVRVTVKDGMTLHVVPADASTAPPSTNQSTH